MQRQENQQKGASNVTLDLSIEEANLVLEALGEMPYRRVYALIVKIQEQASNQLQAKGDDKGSAAAGGGAA